jgi:hypothetical protein
MPRFKRSRLVMMQVAFNLVRNLNWTRHTAERNVVLKYICHFVEPLRRVVSAGRRRRGTASAGRSQYAVASTAPSGRNRQIRSTGGRLPLVCESLNLDDMSVEMCGRGRIERVSRRHQLVSVPNDGREG